MAAFFRRDWTTSLAWLAIVCVLGVALRAQDAAQVGQTVQAAQPPTPEGQGPRAQGPENYTIGAQDVLAITDFDETTLTGQYTVQNDGTLTFPYIGGIKAGASRSSSSRRRSRSSSLTRATSRTRR